MEHVHEGNMSIFEYGKSSNCDFSTHAIVLYFLFRYVQIMDIKTKIPNLTGNLFCRYKRKNCGTKIFDL